MKPSLLIMAAGLGSRYGSLKQIDRFGPCGETIIDYTIFDALRAGFGKVVFVIRKDIAQEFNEVIANRLRDKIPIELAFQEIEMLPQNMSVPHLREKPWGTGHAVMVAADKIDAPFAVVNADDFYGADAFKIVRDYLSKNLNGEANYCIAGYQLENTLSTHGHVSRAICNVDKQGFLKGLTEHTHIIKTEDGIFYRDREELLHPLPKQAIVSMNMMGFSRTIFTHLYKYFRQFLQKHMEDLKAEFYLPGVVDNLAQSGTARVKVLPTNQEWFGVTYPADKIKVEMKIRDLVKRGIYPEHLWR